jgi:TFIIF-interacting CTD phosphatase-like protein
MIYNSFSMPSTVSQCYGCSQPMHNPFVSNVLDHLWHPECVRCFICRCLLNEQCYSREGKLYCKDDFVK